MNMAQGRAQTQKVQVRPILGSDTGNRNKLLDDVPDFEH